MKLILLKCPVCGQPLSPDNDEVVVMSCANCFTPIAIAKDGPVAMDVRFALSLGNRAEIEEWWPFWVFKGSVNIIKRDTQGGSSSARKDSAFLWGAERQLYVPAWDFSLETAQEIGSRLTERQPTFEFVQKPQQASLVPANVSPGDARKILEFIILAIEARRRDWLKDLVFDLNVGQPELWVLPFESFR